MVLTARQHGVRQSAGKGSKGLGPPLLGEGKCKDILKKSMVLTASMVSGSLAAEGPRA